MMQLSPQELAQRLKSENPPRLLDVREPGEFAICSFPGAELIPLGELAARADEIDDWKNDEIIVYCHHGIRSAHAIGHLSALGFTRLFNLAGGIDRWSREVDASVPRY